MASHFAMVDQAVNYMKKVEDYVSAGMDTTIEVAEDVIKGDKDRKNPKLKELKGIMEQYAKMDRDLHQFLDAVDTVKREANNGAENLDTLLEEKLKELEEQDRNINIKNHEKYCDLEEKIEEALAAEDEEEEMLEPTNLDDSGDIAMCQQVVNTKCPYTGKEMKDPVRNKHCNHNYDREGANQLIKARGARAKCPVAGCINEKPVTATDLEDNKELKQHIQRKGKPGRKGRGSRR